MQKGLRTALSERLTDDGLQGETAAVRHSRIAHMCRPAGLSRTSYCHRREPGCPAAMTWICAIRCSARPSRPASEGYRRVRPLLRAEGFVVNAERVLRSWVLKIP
jgi:hypothetical protein